MKVFAQFHDVSPELGIRRNTVLQFGDSWETIGAVWLINPGSSSPCDVPVMDEEREMLSRIDGGCQWSVASIDPTMRFLEKVLNGSYLGEKRELNGVVRLFNLFNLREPDLQRAMSTVRQHPDVPGLVTIEQDVASIRGVRNVYLGWGNVGKGIARPYAERVFALLSAEQKSYCSPSISRNPFYHPMFVNRGIRFSSTRDWLRRYFQATEV